MGHKIAMQFALFDDCEPTDMMTTLEFVAQYPEYAFQFARPLGGQERIFEKRALIGLPGELRPVYPYVRPGRGRVNRDQTKTHSRCATCYRVLRNDHFYVPDSFRGRNLAFSQCIECVIKKNQQRYQMVKDTLQGRRLVVWQYVAPACAICGYDAHPVAMDMHHIDTGEKETLVSVLITQFVQAPARWRAEKMLTEARKCVPLCSNCHRILHFDGTGMDACAPLEYTADALLDELRRSEPGIVIREPRPTLPLFSSS